MTEGTQSAMTDRLPAGRNACVSLTGRTWPKMRSLRPRHIGVAWGTLSLPRNAAPQRHGSDDAQTPIFDMMAALPSDHPDIAPFATGDSACVLTSPN